MCVCVLKGPFDLILLIPCFCCWFGITLFHEVLTGGLSKYLGVLVSVHGLGTPQSAEIGRCFLILFF